MEEGKNILYRAAVLVGTCYLRLRAFTDVFPLENQNFHHCQGVQSQHRHHHHLHQHCPRHNSMKMEAAIFKINVCGKPYRDMCN